jgi:hypothetical protein
MKRKHNYDPVREMYDALGSEDITLEYLFMLYGTEREALRILKHGFSDGFLEAYEYIGTYQRYLDVWELEEVTRNMATEKGKKKLKEIFVSVTKKGREGKK